jgi:transcriptional regulator with XRE-family HTH domain
MLNIGDNIIILRKRKSWSQTDLAKAIGASRDIVGKYERGENSPSIEMAAKLAKAFDITVDYLLGNSKHASYDKDVINRIEEMETIDINTKTILYNIIDTYLRDYKARKAYSK